jgi:hypothetical protein
MTDDRAERPLSTADIFQAGNTPPAQPEIPQRAKAQAEDRPVPLLNTNAENEFRSLWTEIQGRFVDDPRLAVEQADSLVAELMKRIAEMFSQERSKLESQWTGGGDVTTDTEDLRIALQRYRSFFNRLLSL